MRRALPCVLTTLAAACSRPGAPIPVAFGPARCVLLAPDSAADTVTIGVPEPVDLTHAPVPTTEAERFVFALFYETLVRLDCQGQMEPALATRWTRETADGRRWVITLRDDARFWDGTPVTAHDVVAAWADRAQLPAESIAAIDDRTLGLVLPAAEPRPPLWWADPRFAISRAQRTTAPPAGTGPYAIAALARERLEARPVEPDGPLVRFRLGAAADPRDLLEQGADLLVTDDPEVLWYAAGRDAFDLVPLPWAWTYVFVGESRVWADDVAAVADLAGGAVQADVRPAEPPFWWSAAPRCGGAGAPVRYPSPGSALTISYPATDSVAHDMAARLVALAFPERLRAQGLGPSAFAEALAANRGRGFIVALPRRGFAGCLDLPAGVVIPLLDARSWIVARRGRVGVEVEWDGTPRVMVP